MILAAGFGKRINPLTLTRPKPLLKIGKETLLSNTLKFLELCGVKKVVINVHYLREQIVDYINNNQREKLNSVILNDDGRTEKALVEGVNFKEGKYELVFFVGSYFKKITETPKIPFLDDVIIKFGISNAKEHYHVPLLVSPWSYSTYRGS